MVGPPKVINKYIDDKLLEPFEVKVILNIFYKTRRIMRYIPFKFLMKFALCR